MPDMIARAWLDQQFEIAEKEYRDAAVAKGKDAGSKKVRMRILSEIALSPDKDTILDEGQQAFIMRCIGDFAPFLWTLEHEDKKFEAASRRASKCLMLAEYMDKRPLWVRAQQGIATATE